ncbi:crotonobetainyl-CoA:carnitine CoA-transferase CaiB-like acyl-CoA transferase [Cupriavidus metallidurans]|uniref:Acyl-CoA transferase/carnitine dehydratase /bile acid-inducible protein F n=1 Tax=Cupriavidus metallidurans (strain ATCC 43123 / DSM 2839 / NBRC 102507 / CH34) TaxID=266264 RepID=Q1LEW5_CUPMC|nr:MULTISPECIES: CoA transferase [Cupriavidus]ABF11311.1 Acyl-CoA transferase/carnitine dehydratase /bile acid-inducible protein F [Cupriavidus metallidurans CH34]EKZ97956.1 acyl-CoA transferase [Cupriavidus sp. HMR-1]KWW39204.1 Acetyl-CoA:oxalate CoA-transferase [Cupriavidus metallidurans]MDE4920424.1 CoA transferase [Cupriavidus metallidurans]QGS33232.1 CoA transferase [Cupriavidus metallidurans]
MGSGPLSRFTVLDLTRVRSGPAAVRQFADWGANVIKIEEPGLAPDDRPGGSAQVADYQNTHRNKQSITLNLKHPEGRALFLDLVRKADVVVENYRPSVKFKLGIDYESLRKVNPRIVYGSVSGFGQDGPYHDRPGLDQIAQGISGMMSVTGEPGRGPMRAGIPVADLTAGLFCAIGVMVALLEREVSGQGQWVQTSLLQSQLWMMDFQAMRWLMNGEVPGQSGNDHPTSSPTGVFPTADGHMNIAAMGNDIFARLCNVLGAPELVQDERFRTVPLRARHRAALGAEIAERTRTRTTQEWIARMNEEGVPCGPILNMKEAFADPQVEHLRMSQPIDHPTLGPISVVGQAVTLSRTPMGKLAPAPESGEHNLDVYRALLGLDAAKVEALAAQGVI